MIDANQNRGVYEAVFEVFPPVTEPQRVSLDGVLSFAFHNNGTATAVINDHWTVKPGSTQQLTVMLPNMVINDRIKVTFTGVGTQNLEISAMRLKGWAFSNFTKDDPTN
jgi:hypothetical protein